MFNQKFYIVAVLGAALLLTIGFASTSTAALAIDEFILYGVNGVFIGAGSEVTGLVGVENNDPVNDAAVKLNGGATINGDARSGGDVNLQNNADITGTVYHLTGTEITMGSGSSIGDDQTGDNTVVMLPGLPSATSLTCPTGGANNSGANGQVLALTPGSYGAVQYGSGLELTLNGYGDYYFDSITAGGGAKVIVTQAPVRIFVCGATRFTGSVEILSPNNPTPTNLDLKMEVQASGDNAFRAAGGSNWIGDVFAPNGEIHIGGGGCCSFFSGRFWGQNVDVEHSTYIYGSTCCKQLPKIKKDATMLHGQKKENNGANLSLRVGQQIFSLVGFDVSGVDLSDVTKATLVLTVCHTPSDPSFCPDPPNNWLSAGGKVYVYRLDDGFENWAEGNGNNFPVDNNPRGSGQGVTWNCTIDTDIANQSNDCLLPTWGNNGGLNFQGPASAPALHFNLPTFTDGTEVKFDVTSDVQDGFGPNDTSYMTWFLRKPAGSGRGWYYSKEGADAVGNPNLAPRLVIEP